MSLNDLEAVQIKVAPNDEANTELNNVRHHTNNNIHQVIEEELDWSIEAYSARMCRDQLVKNDQVTTSIQMNHVNSEIKKETEQWSKASQDSWYVDHVEKVERDINMLDGSEAPQVKEYSHDTLMQSKTQAACKKLDIKKEPNAIKSIDTSNSIIATSNSMIATPTVLYIDHVVKVERESDEFANKEVNNQNHLSKQSEKEAEDTQHMESEGIKTGLRTDTMVKIESVDPLAELYKDHEVKEELVVGPEVMQRSHQGSITDKEQNKQMGTTTKSLSHQISNEREKPHKCDVCGFVTADRYKLTHHKRKHSDDKPFRCNLCSYASAFKRNLQIHEGTHAKIKPYKCDKCSYACRQKRELMVHERKHTGEKPFKCNYCVYACTRKHNLLEHIKTHTGEKAFKCQHCDYGSTRKQPLIAHTSRYHGKNNDGFTKIYKCNYCNFSTPLRQSCIAHERVMHSSEGQYHCKYCNYAVSCRTSFLNHIKEHTGEPIEKLHKCSYCDYTTKLKVHLSAHERKMHTSKKPYQCKDCNYAVSCRTSFLNHIKKHSGEPVEKLRKCSYCDYATNHKNHLSAHERKHTGEKPYRCSHCAYASAHKHDLFVHELLHKGDKLHKCN